MSELAIQAAGLSKRFQINQGAGASYVTLRDQIAGWFSASRRRQRPAVSAGRENMLWALQDISFKVNEGEVVGIVGRNGAGKSTLLKILARITEPTRGTVDLYGRVGSLLEVGTGFHAELTGRENIYLNGAILGMRNDETRRKFDEIVAFSEVEQFIDTPVKFYSSGMYMRLAFAVAAHLEPEILLVDEVLSVGDAAFQKKCLGKMSEVARQGRTVLFVSHQLNVIQALCPRCLLLDRGRLLEDGETAHILAHYLGSGLTQTSWTPGPGDSVLENPYFNPTRLVLVDENLDPLTGDLLASQPFTVLIEGQVSRPHAALSVGFAVYAASGELLFWSQQIDTRQQDWPVLEPGLNRLAAQVPAHLLNEGDYRIELMVSLHFQGWFSQPGVNAPFVNLSVRGGLSESPYWVMARPGLIAPVIPFRKLD